MKPLRAVAPVLAVGLSLAIAAWPAAQENDKPKPAENRKAPRERPQGERPAQQQHEAPARRQEQQAPPVRRQEQQAAPVQRSAPQERRDEAGPRRQRPESQPESRPNAPQQQAPRPQQQQSPAQVYQPRPNQQTQQPSNPQPGRTFGNQPGRTPDPNRGPGMNARPAAAAPRTFTTRSGDVIHRDSSGQVRQVRTSNGTVLYHPPNAPRRVEIVGNGGRVVVAGAPGHGYVQRPVVVQNTTIIKRTYVYNGVPQARLYRPRMYNGVSLVVYTPVRYYRPAFYTYAYNPWPRPIVYSWGWSGRPWYGYYGGYFTPYPVYASPALWLTDFMLSAMLESAYEERMASRAYAPAYYDAGQPAPMDPEVKQAISDEVRRQIERERAEGQMANSMDAGPDSALFNDNVPHVFVVSAALSVDSNRGECSLREGDVLQMSGPPRPNSTSGDLVVLSSLGQDCAKGSTVSVQLQDLQEMQNQMRATLDRGMGDLQSRQGQNGLPPLPQGAAGTIDSPLAREAQPDNGTAQELADATREGDRLEQQAVSQSSDAPPVLTLGMNLDDVRSIQGEPQKIVDLGDRKIYVYKDLKITFKDGKVTDIQ